MAGNKRARKLLSVESLERREVPSTLTFGNSPDDSVVRPAPNAGSNANDVGIASASNTHNGHHYTLGAGGLGDATKGLRGDEIKAFQANQ